MYHLLFGQRVKIVSCFLFGVLGLERGQVPGDRSYVQPPGRLRGDISRQDESSVSRGVCLICLTVVRWSWVEWVEVQRMLATLGRVECIKEIGVCRYCEALVSQAHSGSLAAVPRERSAKTPGSTPCWTLKSDLYCP